MANEEEGGKIGLERKEIREFVEEGIKDMKKDVNKKEMRADFCSLFGCTGQTIGRGSSDSRAE